MAESDLSAEVNATTVLPAPSNLSATTDSNDDVELSWTNNDDSSDGGIDVERSTDGFSTVNTVASGLSTSTTSYTDTTASIGTTYEYRAERNTDHATATSPTTSITPRNQIGTAKIRASSTVFVVPVYSTESLSEKWLSARVDGTAGLLRPIDSAGEQLRVRHPSKGVFGVETI